MPQVEITGTVPITLTVDLETGEVTEVHVWDEEATLDPAPEGDDEYARALEAAGDGDWPAWEFGA
jgi:hypothetical protein